MNFDIMTGVYVLFRGIFDAFIHFVERVLGIINKEDPEETSTTASVA